MDKIQELALLKSTALIRMCDKDKNVIYNGSSFFVADNNQQLFLVTNNHVIEKSNYCLLLLSLFDQENDKIIQDYVFFELGNSIVKHGEYDLCVVNITHKYDDLISQKLEPVIFPIAISDIVTEYDTFNHIEEIYMIGYPNLKVNRSANYPMVRKGITATGLCDTIDVVKKEMFIMDIPTYRGSSGSPIYYISESGNPKLVGVATGRYSEEDYLYEMDQEDSDNVGDSKFIENKEKYIKVNIGLGIAIKANIILELLNTPN